VKEFIKTCITQGHADSCVG